MSLIPEKCVEYDEVRQKCVASENGKTYTLINKTGYKIRKIKSDGCLCQQPGEKRCDYLMSINEFEIKKFFFIELKGGALYEAVKQIYSTIIYLKKELQGYTLEARIVGSRSVPTIGNLPIHRKLEKEIKATKGKIEKRTNKEYSEII